MEKQKGKKLDKWLALFVVIIGTFMAILDSSIVNIALPKMMAVFGVTLNQVKWILTAYTLALGAIIPLTGFLIEVLGTKKLYMFALAMFTIGSLLCGFAWSNTSMIFFRVVQALGGGMIMPVGMSIIYQIIPQEERGLALGFWGIASMAAPAIGPTLGGYIIEYMDWRLIFNVNVPIGIIGFILAGLLLKNSQRKPVKNFDLIGFLSSSVGIVCILYVLGEGSTIDWTDMKNPMLLTLGCLSLVFFIFNELTHSNPLLELRVLKIFDFGISQVITCVLTFALMGGTYVLPLFLQNLRGYTAMQSGMILFPSAVAVGIMMPISGALFDKVGAKPVVLPGFIILAITSYKLSLALDMDVAKEVISGLLFARGIGLGLAMMPINTAGMNAVPPQLVPKASALSNTIRQVSGSVSITIMTTIIQSKSDFNYARLSEQITEFNQTAAAYIKQLEAYLMQGPLSQGEAHGTMLTVLQGMIQKQASLDAMRYAIAVSVIAVVIAGFLVLFMRSKKKNQQKEESSEGIQDAVAIH